MTARETSRARWVRETRESVLRALLDERGVPQSAGSLEDNLDVTHWTSIGPMGVRSAREIGAALRWLEQQGLAEAVERDEYDPPGKVYVAAARAYEGATA